MRTGTAISGGAHLGILALVMFGPWLFSGQEARPLNVTNVELVDGTNFDAQLSTAPVVPNEGPAELMPEAQVDQPQIDIATPELTLDVPEMPLLAETDAPPDERPDFTNLLIPPPPVVVPTEAPRPSIAVIPSPDPLIRQAETPESPPSTEPLQPLASAPAPAPAPRPAPPPEPEPVAAEEPQPEPEKPTQEPEPQAVAEAQPDAPIEAAPQEALLPVARPAKLAAAAQASSAPDPVKAAPKPKDEPKPAKQASGSKSQFAATVTIGEQDALRLGIKQYFVYNGNRSDRSLQVTLGIELSQDGRIIRGPELLHASGGDEGSRQALFMAGTRALKKAAVFGEFAKLPPAKYEGWRLIHVTFTPEEEIGFST
ncbi:MAG TPA: hypothetical protein VLA52_00890 [Thermohalobaculum sp.]|nr:hypothetical protein [Thermohalobaculum sp.]